MDDEISSKFLLFSPWTFVLILLILILGNLFIIDVALFWNKDTKKTEKALTSNLPDIVSITPTVTSTPSCGVECKKEINEAVAKLIDKPQKTSTSSNIKEFFVPLGTGSSSEPQWSDVAGVQSYIDSNAYGKLKSVTFEASLHTPTNNQEAEARLYNITDSHPVWNSEVKVSGGTPQLKISSPITLDKGSKLYQVQMRTQLQSRTNLENARVHIIAY